MIASLTEGIDHSAAIRALCAAIKQPVLALVHEGAQIVVRVPPLTRQPATVITRLYKAMSGYPYGIMYSMNVEDGAEHLWFTPTRRRR